MELTISMHEPLAVELFEMLSQQHKKTNFFDIEFVSTQYQLVVNVMIVLKNVLNSLEVFILLIRSRVQPKALNSVTQTVPTS